MTQATELVSEWEQLPLGLWSMIFSRLADTASFWDGSREVHKLLQVCRVFRNIFTLYPHLHSSIRLRSGPAVCNLPELLHWIRRHSLTVRQYIHDNSPWSEIILSALLSHEAPVVKVVSSCSLGAIHLLAAFKTLTHCTLKNERQDWFSLKPLQALPSLNSLYLQGGDFVNERSPASLYTDLDAAAKHLTYLRLHNCNVKCTSNLVCVTSLLELSLAGANLLQFHDHGLAAFAAYKCSSATTVLSDHHSMALITSSLQGMKCHLVCQH